MGSHLRNNIVGYVAVFIALSGTAAALPGKNQVDSGDLKRSAVRTDDVKNEDLTGEDIAADSLTGEDIDEAKLNGLASNPTGPAGGDLAGSFPNPSLASNAVGSGEIQDGGVTGDDVDEGSLGQVPSAAQAGSAANAGLLDSLDSPAFVQDSDSLPGSSDLAGTYATPQIDADAVGGAEVASNTLTDADISNTSTLDTDEINEAGLDGIVHTSGASSCCELTQEVLALGTPFSAGDASTFVTHNVFQLRSNDDADKVTFCVLASPVGPVFVTAYLSGTRATLSLGPGTGPLCQTLDINGAATNSTGDFEFRTSGLWMMGVGSSETMVFALG